MRTFLKETNLFSFYFLGRLFKADRVVDCFLLGQAFSPPQRLSRDVDGKRVEPHANFRTCAMALIFFTIIVFSSV
jgi:hypothetical protein